MSHEHTSDASPSESFPIRPGVPVRLSQRVWRVTGLNAGPLTGPGTNSYFVGEGAHWALIDPGPADARHLRTLQRAAPGPIEHILVTHTHSDHSPGAAVLRPLTGAQLLGRRSSHTENQDHTFTPDRELCDGDTLTLGNDTTLRVLHTPGHASNHLCYRLEQERLLFTGDHIIQGSTVVIAPPDGDMRAYLCALERVLAEDLAALAPGHGTLMTRPREALRALIDHRLSREARVYAALDTHESESLATVLERAYADVPVAMHWLAKRSLLAHLLKLEADGRARRHDDRWIAVP